MSSSGSGNAGRQAKPAKSGLPKSSVNSTTAGAESAEVDAFAASLPPPRAELIAGLRALMRELDPAVSEGIKWKVPSWRTHEWFATTHTRVPQGLGLILHFGAKVKPMPEGGPGIEDPDGLLKWLGTDRAMLRFADAEALTQSRAAVLDLLRQWLRHL